jgi:hypothetical protein
MPNRLLRSISSQQRPWATPLTAWELVNVEMISEPGTTAGRGSCSAIEGLATPEKDLYNAWAG